LHGPCPIFQKLFDRVADTDPPSGSGKSHVGLPVPSRRTSP
jgi:hypothetical protein